MEDDALLAKNVSQVAIGRVATRALGWWPDGSLNVTVSVSAAVTSRRWPPRPGEGRCGRRISGWTEAMTRLPS